MLQSIDWIPAHRFLFPQLRTHLFGWPRFLVPERASRRIPARVAIRLRVHTQHLHRARRLFRVSSYQWMPKLKKLALFRYGVIAPLILEALPCGELTRRSQEIAARHYDILNSNRSSSRNSITSSPRPPYGEHGWAARLVAHSDNERLATWSKTLWYEKVHLAQAYQIGSQPREKHGRILPADRRGNGLTGGCWWGCWRGGPIFECGGCRS
jgi:hypothetical protein